MTRRHDADSPIYHNALSDPDLDNLIADANAELDSMLDEVIDLNAGWQTLQPQQPSATPEPAPCPVEGVPDTDLYPELIPLDKLPGVLAGIDQDLAEVIYQLGRVTSFVGVVEEHCPQAVSHAKLSSHEVLMLRRGLRIRVLGKARSSGHVRRAKGELDKACVLLERAYFALCDQPADHRRLQLVRDAVEAARMLLEELHPRIMRLFDNADETDPCTPVPRR